MTEQMEVEVSQHNDKTQIIQCSDGKEFELTMEECKRLKTIKNILEDLGDEDDCPIPLPNIMSNIMEQVITYLRKELANPRPFEEEESNQKHFADSARSPWENEFMAKYSTKENLAELFDIILACNFLDYNYLLNLACCNVAELIKGKTLEDTREFFGVTEPPNDDELAKIEKEHSYVHT